MLVLAFEGKTDVSVYICGLCCLRMGYLREDLRKSIVGSLNRIDYPLLSGPYSKPVRLLVICQSRKQAEYGVTLPQSVRGNQVSDDLVLLVS